MSLLIVGSTALDSIKTPKAEYPRLLGGSASYAAVAASFFSPVNMVGVVGDDFPDEYVRLYKKFRINLDGLQRQPGRTFHWSGLYEINMNVRHTLETELGVFETFTPTLPKTYQKSQFVLLANIAPSLQHHVLDQMARPRLVIADTMDLWLNIALPELLQLLKRVDGLVLNDSEARQLTKEDNVVLALQKIHRLGPRFVIIKKGEHGSILSFSKGYFICPAVPLERFVDPTGAGDCFVGGLMGYLASEGKVTPAAIRRGMAYGTVVASFCCEGYGLTELAKIRRPVINRRMRQLESYATI